jgi:hypothetical protein
LPEAGKLARIRTPGCFGLSIRTFHDLDGFGIDTPSLEVRDSTLPDRSITTAYCVAIALKRLSTCRRKFDWMPAPGYSRCAHAGQTECGCPGCIHTLPDSAPKPTQPLRPSGAIRRIGAKPFGSSHLGLKFSDHVLSRSDPFIGALNRGFSPAEE